MAIDSRDNVYFCEVAGPGRIRKIDVATGIISTYLEGDAGWSIAFDAGDNLYRSTGTQLFRMNVADGAQTLIAGTVARGFSGDGGDARLASFEGLQFFALDPAGNIYAADNGNFRIRRISRDPSAPQYPIVLRHPVSQTVVTGGDVALSADVGGGGTLSYQWRRNGIDLPGATNPDLTLRGVTSADGGIYTLAARDKEGGVIAPARLSPLFPALAQAHASPTCRFERSRGRGTTYWLRGL